MGLAIDTVGARSTGQNATFTAMTASTGDTFTVRNGAPQSNIWLTDMFTQYITAGAQLRVRSPFLVNNSQGILFIPGVTPSRYNLPRGGPQMLHAQDTLIVEDITAANEVFAAALQIYYENLPGISARLHSPGDILNNIKHIVPIIVATAEAGTAGQWADVVITHTEDLTEANSDYAVLGVITDHVETAIGIKGTDTGNLRICSPGTALTESAADYFVTLSERLGKPCIPVFNSANKNNTFASVLSNTTGNTPNVQLICALLNQNLPN